MGDDRTETLTRLFAEITRLIEDAHETATAGQSARLALSKLADHALRLEQAASDIATLAKAAQIVAGAPDKHDSGPRRQRR